MDLYGNSVLLVIDVQNDFCPGGRLAVKDGDRVVPFINEIMDKFGKVVATQDWHPEDHLSFASNHPGKEVMEIETIDGIEQVLWPDHCIQGTEGANFYPGLNIENISLILRKGMDKRIDSYSAFFENDKKTSTGLDGYLRNLHIDTVYLTGLATDYCVYYTAIDAVKLGYRTNLFIKGSRGVNFPEGNVERAVNDMKERGVKIIE
ncbi:MAG: bifunctional nicotinamidase/pyrazinamidase [Spirochaetes bacterium]|nr:MAG: bifunctional nicotinamidase/pyrazinamidase [Spirochaetota bacterium]